MDERSRRRLWEDFAFNFLQKLPQGAPDAVKTVAILADDMLAEHDKRWKSVLTLPKSQVK